MAEVPIRCWSCNHHLNVFYKPYLEFKKAGFPEELLYPMLRVTHCTFGHLLAFADVNLVKLHNHMLAQTTSFGHYFQTPIERKVAPYLLLTD